MQITPIYNKSDFSSSLGFPGSSDGNESACGAGDPGDPWVRKIPSWWEWQPTPSILVWIILWTEETGGPQSTGSQSVRRDWVTNTFIFLQAWFIITDSNICSRTACVSVRIFKAASNRQLFSTWLKQRTVVIISHKSLEVGKTLLVTLVIQECH